MSWGDSPRRGTTPRDPVGRLLQLGGERQSVPSAVAARVRSTVELEWRRIARSRRRVRRLVLLAATVVLVALPGWLGDGGPIAGIERSVDDVWVLSGEQSSRSMVGRDLAPGTTVWTGESGAVALRMSEGVALRLGATSRLTLVDETRLELEEGAFYFDSGRDSGGAFDHPRQNPVRDLRADATAIEVRTPFGLATNLGTRYMIELDKYRMWLRVRDGQVRLRTLDGSDVAVAAGEEIELNRAGAIRRRSVAASGADWSWTMRVPSPFDMEGSDLDSFLAWTSRETGLSVRFSPDLDERALRSIVLRGSLAGVSPEIAFEEVLPMCGLRSSVEEGVLWIAGI